MIKRKLPAFLLSLVLLSGCTGQDMTIIDQNGKPVDVAAAGKNTYTFQLPSNQKASLPQQETPFLDMDQEDWFYESVRFCYENHLMSGITENAFQPGLSTSRAMIVSILWRLDGSPAAGENAFSDVPSEQYYADAVAWAAAEGIVSGYDATHFAPDAPISREQFAAILYRYAAYHQWDCSFDVTLTDFADASAVSPYAADALSWAVSHGIISGMDNQFLSPQSEATRAQAAAILMHLCETFAK